MDKRVLLGWIAVGISIIITGFWAIWGIIENFHEGWYSTSWISNVGLMLVQYLSPMLVFLAVTLISIFWPKVGSVLHIVLAVFAAWFFQAITNPGIFVLIAPLIGLGVLYWFGRPQPRKLAAILVAGLPLLVLIIAGIEPAWRVSRRYDDGNLQARRVSGNGVDLIWAPQGPGWPSSGTSWEEANEVCLHLNDEGDHLLSETQDIWRLPNIDEAVGSMTRHAENSGGRWNADSAQASYSTRPDKESPLWDVHSQVIYWWTATEADEGHAFIIVYNGQVWPRSKSLNVDYLGYRCVREP